MCRPFTLRWNASAAKWTNYTFDSFEYSGANLIMKETSGFDPSSSTWQKRRRTDYTYSGSKLTEERLSLWSLSSKAWLLNSRTQFDYTADRMVEQREDLWQAASSSWKPSSAIKWEYLLSGSDIIASYRREWYDIAPVWLLTSVDSFEYAGGALLREWHLDSFRNGSVYQYAYLSGGRTDTISYKSVYEGRLFDEQRSLYLYDGLKYAGTIFQRYDSAKKSWDPYAKFTLQYDSYGNVEIEELQDWNGTAWVPHKIDPIFSDDYEYNVKYYYDETPAVIPKDSLFTDELILQPNPAGASSTLSFVLPEAEQIQLQILDVCGRIVYAYSALEDAGKHRYQLPLSSCSSGLYVVRLTKGKNPAANLKLIHTE